MARKSIIVAAIAAAASVADAKTIRVEARTNGFSPDTITAEMGDTIAFHFFPANHSVAMGNFLLACTPANENGFFSGFFPVEKDESDEVFLYRLNTTDPVVFYSTQDLECANGMAGVINQGTDNQTLAAYKELSNGISMAVTPTEVYGGERRPAKEVGHEEIQDGQRKSADDSDDNGDSAATRLVKGSVGWLVAVAAFAVYAL